MEPTTNWLAGRLASLVPNLVPQADASAASCSTGSFCNSGICVSHGQVYTSPRMIVTFCSGHMSITESGCC
jgi:hypothetical protein